MSDTTSAPETGETAAPGEGQAPAQSARPSAGEDTAASTAEGFKSPESKDRVLADLAKERDRRQAAEAAHAELAARVRELEDKDLSAQQKLERDLAEQTAARQAAEDEASRLRLGAARIRAAVTHQLPAEMADRLRGDSQEEIDDDAARLAGQLAAMNPPRTPGADPSQGQGPTRTAEQELYETFYPAPTSS